MWSELGPEIFKLIEIRCTGRVRNTFKAPKKIQDKNFELSLNNSAKLSFFQLSTKGHNGRHQEEDAKS